MVRVYIHIHIYIYTYTYIYIYIYIQVLCMSGELVPHWDPNVTGKDFLVSSWKGAAAGGGFLFFPLWVSYPDAMDL